MSAAAAIAQRNRAARDAALAGLGESTPSDLPPITYASSGRVLILGPEHRVRRAAARLDGQLEVCGLITEAMPEQITAEIEEAAGLAGRVPLFRTRLLALDGYLGHFDARIELDGKSQPLAELVFGVSHCDAVLDLGSRARIERELPPPGYFHATDEIEAALAALSDLRGSFEKPRYVLLDNAVCAHGASGLTGCTRCLEACPADAIRSIDGAIRIDNHLCHGAGGCATSCPTGAIRYARPEPAQLHRRLGALLATYRASGGRAPRLLIHDAQAGRQWLDTRLAELEGGWLPLEIEEAGAAGIELWLQALAQGALEVAVLLASPLPPSVRRDLERELAIAEGLLGALGTGHRVRLFEAKPGRLPDALADTAVRPIPPMRAPAAEATKRERISEACAHLYRSSGLAPGDRAVAMPAGAPFGTLAFDAAGCTLCMSCVSVCPAKALGAGRDRPQLSFNEDRCVQCGLCAQACPEKVLRLEPRYQLDAELRCTARTLKQELPFHCVRCGKPFATHSMIRNMQAKLAGHRMFAGRAAERLKMCGDCRVIDIAQNDPDSGLAGLAGTDTGAAPPGGRH